MFNIDLIQSHPNSKPIWVYLFKRRIKHKFQFIQNHNDESWESKLTVDVACLNSSFIARKLSINTKHRDSKRESERNTWDVATSLTYIICNGLFKYANEMHSNNIMKQKPRRERNELRTTPNDWCETWFKWGHTVKETHAMATRDGTEESTATVLKWMTKAKM